MDHITVLKFFATWCAPCRVYKPTFEKVVEKLGVNAINVDVDEQGDLKEHFKITSIPATVIIHNETGEVLASRQGTLLNKQLTEMIEEAAQHG